MFDCVKSFVFFDAKKFCQFVCVIWVRVVVESNHFLNPFRPRFFFKSFKRENHLGNTKVWKLIL